MSLRGLAQRMGLGHSQLSLTFSGARRPQLDEVAQLAQIFGEPLSRVVEALGVSVRTPTGRRVSVIGAVTGDGTVAMHTPSTVERTSAPEDVPEGAIAVQCRTAGTPLEWADGMVMFSKALSSFDPSAIGRLALCRLKAGPVVLATIRRGYAEGSHNLVGFHTRENAQVEQATPVMLIRP